MSKIKVGDKLKTRCGLDVEITGVLDADTWTYPIRGVMDGVEFTWMLDGKYQIHALGPKHLDLIIPDQPEETLASQYISHVTEIQIMNGTDLSANVSVFDEGAAKVEIATLVNAKEWSALSASILAALQSMKLEGDK